jgi:hypothetical protein
MLSWPLGIGKHGQIVDNRHVPATESLTDRG